MRASMFRRGHPGLDGKEEGSQNPIHTFSLSSVASSVNGWSWNLSCFSIINTLCLEELLKSSYALFSWEICNRVKRNTVSWLARLIYCLPLLSSGPGPVVLEFPLNWIWRGRLKREIQTNSRIDIFSDPVKRNVKFWRHCIHIWCRVIFITANVKRVNWVRSSGSFKASPVVIAFHILAPDWFRSSCLSVSLKVSIVFLLESVPLQIISPLLFDWTDL